MFSNIIDLTKFTLAIFVLIMSLVWGSAYTAQAETINNQYSVQLSLIQKLLEQVQILQKQLLALQTNMNTSPMACTRDAMMCSDGSSVGRTGPNCSFAACSSAIVDAPMITSVESKEYNGTIYLKIYGKNLTDVKKAYTSVLVDGEQEVKIATTQSDVVEINYPYVETYNNRDDNRLSIRLKSKDGKYSDWFTLDNARHTLEGFTSNTKPFLSFITFSETGATDDTWKEMTYQFTTVNWRSGLAVRVEPVINCKKGEDCSDYLFSLQQKAGDSYTNVRAENYVKGGSDYTFDGVTKNGGDEIFIKSFPNSKSNSPLSNVESINYKFILMDTKDGNEELWSKEYTIQN